MRVVSHLRDTLGGAAVVEVQQVFVGFYVNYLSDDKWPSVVRRE